MVEGGGGGEGVHRNIPIWENTSVCPLTLFLLGGGVGLLSSTAAGLMDVASMHSFVWGGASFLRGGASFLRGGASFLRGGASFARGGASFERGGASSSLESSVSSVSVLSSTSAREGVVVVCGGVAVAVR